MADISKLSRLFNGVQRNVDIASNTLVTQSIKVGGPVTNTELTKAILDNLVTLQGGGDAGSLHHHDGRYYTETELGATSGTSGAERIGVEATPTNYSAGAANVEAHLAGIDAALATAGGSVFADDEFRIEDNADATKKIAFEAGGIAPSTVRTITMPDANVNLGDVNNAILKDGSRAFTADQSMGGFLLKNLGAPVEDGDAAQWLAVQEFVHDYARFQFQNTPTTSVNITSLELDAAYSMGALYVHRVNQTNVTHLLPGQDETVERGRLFMLVGASDTNTVMIAQTGPTLSGVPHKLKAPARLKKHDVIVFSWVSDTEGWVEVFRDIKDELVRADGTVPMTSHFNLAGFDLINVDEIKPVTGQDIDIKVDDAAWGSMSTTNNGSGFWVSGAGDSTQVYSELGEIELNAGNVTNGKVRVASPKLEVEGKIVMTNAGKIENLGAGTVATDAINKGQLDAVETSLQNAINAISTGLEWRPGAIAATGDSALNSAADDTALSTLLPFSDDDAPQMVIGDFADGQYLLSKNGASSKLFRIYDDAGTLKVTQAGVTALAAGHVFLVRNDLPDTPASQEGAAIYAFNGSDLVKVGDVDWSVATGIDLSGSFTSTTGTVAAGDSVELAIAKLVGNLAAHLADTSDAHDASAISVAAGIAGLAATDVQAALAEISGDASAAQTAISDHLADTTDAHDASAISVAAGISGLAATDVQAALAEISGDANAAQADATQALADAAAAQADADAALAALPSKANVTLNNLGTTAINAALIPDGNATRNIGSATNSWQTIYTREVRGNGTQLDLFNDGVGNVGIFIHSTFVEFAGDIKAAGQIDMNPYGTAYKIVNLDTPTAAGDATNKDYVDHVGGTKKRMVAGEAMAANTSFLVRFAMNGETAGRMYKADKDASSSDKFYAVGLALKTSAVNAGDSVTVTIEGTHILGSSDTAFNAADIGKPVYLTAAGAFSVTAPSAADEAVYRVGVVENTDRIWVGDKQLNGIN